MDKNVIQQAEQYRRKRTRRKTWKKIVTGLGAVVVFITTYSLILPAITMEPMPTCGCTEHQHSALCYELMPVEQASVQLICQPEVHSHKANCHDADGSLICTQADCTHPPGCYDAEGDLICGLADCLLHSHSDTCYYNGELICSLPEVAEHIHNSECFSISESLICELEANYHVHSELCYTTEPGEPICEPEEGEDHAHTDLCFEQVQTLICEIAENPEGHSHSLECTETNRELICSRVPAAIHTHDEHCLNEAGLLACGILSAQEHVHTADCLQTLVSTAEAPVLTCSFEEHTHTEACMEYPVRLEVPVDHQHGESCYTTVLICGISSEPAVSEQQADTQAHEHTEACYGTMLVCTLPDSTQDLAPPSDPTADAETASDPETESAPELSPPEENYSIGFFSAINESGTLMYHAPDYLEYQYSSHRVNNYMTLTYVLIPYSEYQTGWTPNTLQWSSAANANYVVAYCADRNTDVSESGELYTTQKIQESSYYSAYADVLSGIVEHAYPFITAQEMRQQLSQAYLAGETPVDLSCCVESEFIAAAQWAIWDMTGVSGTQTTASGAAFPGYNADALNPLTDVGHTDASTIQTHVQAIRDWLVTQRAPGDLNVADHQSEITKNPDGTYDIVTLVTLDRPLEERESLFASFHSAKQSTSSMVSGAGTRQFTVSLSGLTADEVLTAQVDLAVCFEHMQVYVYDSENYQDMISGQWGEDVYELSFRVEAETTSVDVTKYWSDNEIGAEYIEVQLYADGVKYGAPVQLSAANGWTYTWDDLLKYSAPDTAIQYTIDEILVPGYLTSITRAEGGSGVLTTFDPADSLVEGATYIFTYPEDGALCALGDETGSGGSGLYWVRNLDAANPGSIPDTVLWTATGVSSDGTSAYLQNAATGNYLSYDGSYITLSSSPSAKAHFLYNHFYFPDSSYTSWHLLYLYDGVGYVTSDWNSALGVTGYKRSQFTSTAADIRFLITNTKTDEDTSVSVAKKWAGRSDGMYPDSAQVRLLQNGVPYGPTVTLNEENGWYYRWEELPLKLGDAQFTYSVEEVQIEDYAATVQTTVGEDGTLLFELTNTWTTEYVPFLLSKVDATDPNNLLPGAQFQLYLTAEEGAEGAVPIPGAADAWGILTQTVATGDDGTFRIDQLWVGKTYCLVETAAPVGYNALDEPIVFTVAKDENGLTLLTVLSGSSWATATGTNENGDLLLQIQNQPGYVLPETGGAGTSLYTVGGLLLMAAAGIFLLYIQKTRGKEDFSSS